MRIPTFHMAPPARRPADPRLSASTAIARAAAIGAAAIVLCAGFNTARAQTVVNGSAMALQSSGAVSGTNWTLSSNGYVGTYVTLAAPGTVSFAVSASGTADAGAPHMNLA